MRKYVFHSVYILQASTSNNHCNFNNKGKCHHYEHISEENGICYLEYEIISIMKQSLQLKKLLGQRNPLFFFFLS